MNRTHEVRGSIPLSSTRPKCLTRLGNDYMDRFTQNDPERQANIAFILIFLGIIAVGALTIWLFYGASF
jgi:hypothetical protein